MIVGPGAMDEEAAGGLTLALLRRAPQACFVIDAAAMTRLRRSPEARKLCGGRAVLTPHHGEMAALMGVDHERVAAEPRQMALQAARELEAVVALKSERTFIAAPDGRVWRNSGGTAGLGVCGSGDVLAGVIGGLLARGAPPETAAIWGVFLHAAAGRHLAAEIGPLGYLARDLLKVLPRVLAQVSVT